MDEVEATIAAAIIEELMEPLTPSLLGPKKSIYCYRPSAGGCPAREFLEGLDRRAKAAYVHLFNVICGGNHLRGEKWHPWTEDDGKGCKGLYEYKDIASKVASCM